MKSIFPALGVCLLATAAAAATPEAGRPEDAVIVEAETMAVAGAGWQPREHRRGWYSGQPSGGQMLVGVAAGAGAATAAVNLPAAAKGGNSRRFLWVRYVDVLTRPERDHFKFVITARQRGKTVGEREFDGKSLRSSPEGIRKWGGGFGQFVWERMEFAAAAGPLELALAKSDPGAVRGRIANGARHIDAMIITSDPDYEPHFGDLRPLYARVEMLPGQTAPTAIHVSISRASRPLQGSAMINRKGLFMGAAVGVHNLTDDFLAPGASSPWIPLSRLLGSGAGLDAVQFYAMTRYSDFRDGRTQNSAFRLLFSKSPDDGGVFLKSERSGPGGGMTVGVNLDKYEIVPDSAGSARSLEYARATGEVPGRRPTAYPLLTAMSLKRAQSTPGAVENELEALETIGINGLVRPERAEEGFPWSNETPRAWYLQEERCPSRPQFSAMENLMRKAADTIAEKGISPFLLSMADEPGLDIKHIVGCAHCIAGFPAFLESLGIALEGVDADKPTLDRSSGARYYWSRRYRNHLMTELLRHSAAAAAKFMPGRPVTVNFATELVYNGNLTRRGNDWFEILESGALTHGWHEDWANHSGAYQVVGYQSDVMRAACRRQGQRHGIINVLTWRHPWDIEAKAFMHIGHGEQAIRFFNYGPTYNRQGDSNSHRPEIFQAIKNIAMPVGAAEGHIVGSSVVKGDAALLLSVTSDLWNEEETHNIFGKERIYLHLLLRHLGFRLDILSEDDLTDALADYRLLFATDSHLRASQADALVSWVENGGTLYLGAGALEFDENNRPLGLDGRLGLKRGKLEIIDKVGRAQYEFPRLKPFATAAGVPVVGGGQRPFNQRVKAGKGEVIASGFFPGIGYFAASRPVGNAARRTADIEVADGAVGADADTDGAVPTALDESAGNSAAGRIYSVRDYPAVYRDYIAGLNLPVKPRLATDNYRIAANLLEAPGADVIVLSNWTGEPATTRVVLEADADYREARIFGAGAGIIERGFEGGRFSVTARVGAGAFVVCEK